MTFDLKINRHHSWDDLYNSVKFHDDRFGIVTCRRQTDRQNNKIDWPIHEYLTNTRVLEKSSILQITKTESSENITCFTFGGTGNNGEVGVMGLVLFCGPSTQRATRTRYKLTEDPFLSRAGILHGSFSFFTLSLDELPKIHILNLKKEYFEPRTDFLKKRMKMWWLT